MNDQDYQKALRAAEKDGRACGLDAGTWAIDGNTPDEGVREILRQIEEGDPMFEPPPTPLAGQWGDDPSEADVLDRIFAEASLDLDARDFLEDSAGTADELLSAWADAWTGGWYDQVESDARARLSPSLRWGG